MLPDRPTPAVAALPMGSEELREALLAVEASRVEERSARRDAEALLAGLQVLTHAAGVGDLFDGILRIVREVVPFDDAVVLVAEGAGLRVLASTSPEVETHMGALPVSGAVERALGGRPAVVADLAQLPQWRALDPALTARFASALLMPVRSRDSAALLMCLHGARGAFARSQVDRLGHILPLAAHALQRSFELRELDHMIRRLEHLAHHDVLTGLENRALFSESMAAAIRRCDTEGGHVGVLHLDLDDFKLVNDTLGHAAGDRFLRAVADRLTGSLRGARGVGRVGGDEFAVVLPGLRHRGDAAAVAERLLDAVRQPLLLEGQWVQPGISIGVATYPDDGPTGEQVLTNADLALYDAKVAGRRRVSLYEPRMRVEVDARAELERELAHGIEAGELRVHYQPIFEARDLSMVAVEALVRWQHPTRGLLAPAAFLPVAMHSDLIVRLGWAVLDIALTEVGPWLRGAPGRRVAINVAPRQLLTTNFVDELLARLAHHGLPPTVLEVELSEEIIVRRTARLAIDMLHRLHREGVQLAFDDFGTGYSSIQQLHTFPGHRLKIDRSFVQEIANDPAAARVVGGLVEVAHGLGLKVVAEGIEDPEQVETLRRLGADELQGFHLARPVARAQCPALSASGVTATA
jgi:diguanylate cyclase (GGDEF)-like protein